MPGHDDEGHILCESVTISKRKYRSNAASATPAASVTLFQITPSPALTLELALSTFITPSQSRMTYSRTIDLRSLKQRISNGYGTTPVEGRKG